MSRNRAFLAVAFENYAIVVVTFVGTAIVSRMLSPREIGLFQLAMLFSTLVSTLRDFGLTEFVVQEKHLTEQRLRTAIGMNFVISYLFGGGLFLLSWPIAAWFREEDVGKMIRIMCISFLFIPIGSVTIAYLKRNLEFVKIMKISIAAVILTQLSILLSVLGGLSSYSLVVGSLMGTAATIIGALLVKPAPVPLRPSLIGIGEQLKFGAHAVSIFGLAHLAKIYPEQLVGRLMGATNVAMFSRAGSLVELFQMAVGRAALTLAMPIFSESARNPDAKRETASRQATALFTAVGWSAAVFMFLMAKSLVVGIFGSQWTEAIPVAQVLCIALACEIPFLYYREMLIAFGFIKPATSLQTIIVIVRIACFTAGIQYGLIGGAYGLVGAAAINTIVIYGYLRHHGLTRSRMITLVLAQSATVASAIGIATWCYRALIAGPSGLSSIDHIIYLAGIAPIALAIWVVTMALTRHPTWHVIQPIISAIQRKIWAMR